MHDCNFSTGAYNSLSSLNGSLLPTPNQYLISEMSLDNFTYTISDCDDRLFTLETGDIGAPVVVVPAKPADVGRGELLEQEVCPFMRFTLMVQNVTIRSFLSGTRMGT